MIRLDGQDGCWIRKALVLYAGNLFESTFKVQPSGMVEMLDDEPVFLNAVSGSAQYEGIWQIIPDARHNATAAKKDVNRKKAATKHVYVAPAPKATPTPVPTAVPTAVPVTPRTYVAPPAPKKKSYVGKSFDSKG